MSSISGHNISLMLFVILCVYHTLAQDLHLQTLHRYGRKHHAKRDVDVTATAKVLIPDEEDNNLQRNIIKPTMPTSVVRQRQRIRQRRRLRLRRSDGKNDKKSKKDLTGDKRALPLDNPHPQIVKAFSKQTIPSKNLVVQAPVVTNNNNIATEKINIAQESVAKKGSATNNDATIQNADTVSEATNNGDSDDANNDSLDDDPETNFDNDSDDSEEEDDEDTSPTDSPDDETTAEEAASQGPVSTDSPEASAPLAEDSSSETGSAEPGATEPLTSDGASVHHGQEDTASNSLDYDDNDAEDSNDEDLSPTDSTSERKTEISHQSSLKTKTVTGVKKDMNSVLSTSQKDSSEFAELLRLEKDINSIVSDIVMKRHSVPKRSKS